METYAVVNPATGEMEQRFPTLSNSELAQAVSQASETHTSWTSSTSVAERARLLNEVGRLHAERRDELAEILVREVGKPVQQGLGEVDLAVEIYAYYAEHAEEFLADEPISLLGGQGSAVIRRSSIGVLLGIMPWNFPYYQVARFAGPNLVLGNTILLKPAPQCPESAEAMQRIYLDAGFPPSAYQNIFASNDQVAEIIGDPRIQGVSLTGSERAGAAVAEIAGRHLKKVVLELGGSDPFIVLGSSHLEEVADAAVAARLENAGQACNAAKRFIIIDDLYDQFVELFTEKLISIEPGDPSSDETELGPLSSAAAADRLEDQIERAVSQGATVLARGDRSTTFVSPTILSDLPRDSEASREEFFGPVAILNRVSSEQEAIEIANDTSFGLGSYVFSDDKEQAIRVANEIDAGMVFVNGVGAEGAELPFGGVKRSGFGRELGRHGIEEFANKKLIRIVE